MGCPRFSVRTMMVVVLGAGTVLHLAVAAWRVHSTKRYYVHTSIISRTGMVPTFIAVATERPPFWPLYWRRVLGRPVHGVGLCRPDDEGLLQTCELDHPEIRGRAGALTDRTLKTPAQMALLQRLLDEFKPGCTVYPDCVECDPSWRGGPRSRLRYERTSSRPPGSTPPETRRSE